MTTPNAQALTGLDAAKKAVGGRALDLAKALKISNAAISKWKGTIPLGRVLEVERATGVPRYLLRPDFFKADTGASEAA